MNTANKNSVQVIAPYRHAGTWVFDDPNVGLVKEPFVSGIPEMIDALVACVPNARQGFRLLFSRKPFAGWQLKLLRIGPDAGGNWYRLEANGAEGWICPALFKYFKTAPRELYVRAEAITRPQPVVDVESKLRRALEQCVELLDDSNTRHYISTKRGNHASLHAALNAARAALRKSGGNS